jgi:hypothetical protein
MTEQTDGKEEPSALETAESLLAEVKAIDDPEERGDELDFLFRNLVDEQQVEPRIRAVLEEIRQLPTEVAGQFEEDGDTRMQWKRYTHFVDEMNRKLSSSKVEVARRRRDGNVVRDDWSQTVGRQDA